MKIKLIYLLCIFSIFSIIGFVLANQVGAVFGAPRLVKAAGTLSQPANLDLNQKKILIVTVNDLAGKDAQLSSVWMGFVMEGDPLSITWKAVYPAPSKQAFAAKLAGAFALTPQKELSSAFLKYLADNEIAFDGYVVGDHFAIGKIKELLDLQGINYAPLLPDTAENAQLILAQETGFIQETCKALDQKNKSFPVADLIPSHLQFKMDANVMMIIMNQLSAEDIKVRCEMVPVS